MFTVTSIRPRSALALVLGLLVAMLAGAVLPASASATGSYGSSGGYDSPDTKPTYPDKKPPKVIKKKKPLKVVKTATTSYVRRYDWTIDKRRVTPSPITSANPTVPVDYVVDVVKSAPVDSDITVTGTITVTNPNKWAAKNVTVTDAIVGGPECTVVNGTGLTIPGNYGKVVLEYSCSLTSVTNGVNKATAKWYGGTSTGVADVVFGDPTTIINDSVTVVDEFNKSGTPTTLTPQGGTNVSASYPYQVQAQVPATGCVTYPNTATMTLPDQSTKSDSETVEVCRTPSEPVPPGPPNPPIVGGGTGTPTPPVAPASLSIVKRGPALARSGQTVTFRITVRNTDVTDAAQSVVLSDLLPAGYRFAAIPRGARLVKGRLVWQVGTLAPGASRSVAVRVLILRATGGTRCNTAIASAGNAATVRARACTRVTRVTGVARVPAVTG